MDWEEIPVGVLLKIAIVIAVVAIILLAGAWARTYLFSNAKVEVIVS